MTLIKILAFAGSACRNSFNKKLVKITTEGVRNAGAEVTYLDFRNLSLPLEDLEEAEGLPANACKLKELMKAHQGFLIACPEHNSSITPLLKKLLKPLDC